MASRNFASIVTLLISGLLLCAGISLAQDTNANILPPERLCGFPEGGFQSPMRTAAITGGLWMRDMDTDEVFRVSTEGAATYATWSPDGALLAYQVREPGADAHSLIFVNRDGKESRKMLANMLVPGVFAWSWGGQCIAYGEKIEGGSALMIADADGANPVQIYVLPVGQTFSAVVWSPDGTRLGWIQVDDKTQVGTFVSADLTGAALKSYLIRDTYAPYRDLAWSSTGRFVAFLGTIHNSSGRAAGYNAYSLEIATNNRIRLSKSGLGGAITWAASGTDVALVENDLLVLVSPDGADRRDTGIPAQGPLLWLKDGGQILTAGMSHLRPVAQLFVIDVKNKVRYPLVDLPVPPAPGQSYSFTTTAAVGSFTLSRLTPEELPLTQFSAPPGLPAINRDNVANIALLAALEGRLSPDLQTKTLYNATHELQLYNARSGVEILERANVAVSPFLSYSPDGRYLAVTGKSADKGAHIFFLWDTVERRALINVQRSSLDTDAPAAFSLDGTRLVVPSTAVWDIETRDTVYDLRTRLPETSISPDGSQVAFLVGNIIYILPSEDFSHMTAAAHFTPEAPLPNRLTGESAYTMTAFSPDGQYLLAGRFDGAIDIWTIADSSVNTVFRAQRERGYPQTMSFSSDGRLLAVGMQGYSYAEPSYMQLWDFVDQTPLLTMDGGSDVMFATGDRALLMYNGVTTQVYSLTPDASAPVTCMLTAKRNGNEREGPGTGYNTAGRIRTGDVLDADGVITLQNGRVWYRLMTGQWIRADLVDAAPECAGLPLVEAP